MIFGDSTAEVCLVGYLLLLAVRGVVGPAPGQSVVGFPAYIEQTFSWLYTPKQPLDVSAWLPRERPTQPWPYRSAALSASVKLTETHALIASVQHAIIPEVSTDMLVWWFNNIQGEAIYPADGKKWPKYLMWHPRDHLYQVAATRHKTKQHPAATAEPSSTSYDVLTTSANAHGGDDDGSPVLWEICEFILCSNPQGWTASTYPGALAAAQEQPLKAVVQVKQLDNQGLWLSLPSSTGLGETFWNLRHIWVDTPSGVLINSSQVIGVVEPAWRPMWFARARNAILRGIYGSGQDPRLLLSNWLQHCIEEMGNLEHILPSLFAQGLQHQPLQQQQVATDTAAGPSIAAVPKEACQANSVPSMHQPAINEDVETAIHPSTHSSSDHEGSSNVDRGSDGDSGSKVEQHEADEFAADEL